MLDQFSTTRNDSRLNVDAGEPVSMLAYRSHATASLSDAQLDDLLANAQARNRAEGLTGILVYDRGTFFQWLEGPETALARVWRSLRLDSRHSNIELLREATLGSRFFDSWHMRLASCAPGTVGGLFIDAKRPQDILKQLLGRPIAMTDGRWRQLFSDLIIPRLSPATSLIKPPVVWHAAQGVSDRLARLMLAADSGRVAAQIDALLAQGAAVGALYREVFEPAERFLGELWRDDLCNDFELTAALALLQIEVRRLGGAALPKSSVLNGDRSILILPHPGENHSLGASMASELFLRDGWDVTCEFPGTESGVCDLVHQRWFDVLELSLSGALSREHQLPAMRDTIHAAHAASLNPGLMIIVDGRIFFEQPAAYLSIAANAGLSSVLDGVRTASVLLQPSRTAIESVVLASALSVA